MARLGCASTYDAEIRFQGGGHLWTTVQGLTALSWGRKRDDWSEGSITVTKSLAGSDCCGKLGQTHTWGHELRIYRDQEPVWEGPIVKVREKRATITFDARDMLFWFDRRSLETRAGPYHVWAGADTGAFLRLVIEEAFTNPDPGGDDWDPGLLAYAILQDSGTTSTTDRLWKHSTSVGEVVRDLIGAGMDMYTIGRAIHLISDKLAAGTAPYRLRETDFLSELEVVENGLDAATQVYVVGGQPVDGSGNPITDPNVSPVIGAAGGWEPFHGLVTQHTHSQNVVQQAVADGIAAARRAYAYPPPVDIIVPSGAKLSPEAPVEMGQLVPGRLFQVSLESYCRNVRQNFRLNELSVKWESATTETVAVSLASGGPAEVAA